MCLGKIDFSDPRVAADHFQSAMAENGLQGNHVAATSQVSYGERVAETMREAVLDPSPSGDGLDQEPQ